MALTSADYEDIRNLYGRYSLAVDSGDFDGYVACYTPDIEMIYEGLPDDLDRNGAHVGHAAVRAMAEDVWAGTQGHVLHVIVPQTIEGDGDVAHVVVYDHVFRRGQAPYSGIIHTGTAEDTLRRTEEGWKYSRRVGHIHRHEIEPVSTDVLVVARDEFVDAALKITA